MANSLDTQITQEGPRNAIVKLTGILDTSDALEIPAISIQDMHNNDPLLYLTGFRVDHIEFSMSQGLEIQLFWNSQTPQQIAPIAGRGKICGHDYAGFHPRTAGVIGYDGSITLSSNGYQPGSIANFTIVLELVKLYTRTFGSLIP